MVDELVFNIEFNNVIIRKMMMTVSSHLFATLLVPKALLETPSLAFQAAHVFESELRSRWAVSCTDLQAHWNPGPQFNFDDVNQTKMFLDCN